MADLSAGINEIKKGQTILLAADSTLRAEFKENPKSFPNVKTFGTAKPIYKSLMFTKNSPLLPMFRQAITQMIESGQYSRVDLKWKGAKIPQEGAAETMILSAGQIFLVFAFLLFFCGTSLILLSFEYGHNFYKKSGSGPVLAPVRRPVWLHQNLCDQCGSSRIF